MLLLALRNLLEEKQRFVTCLGGVAVAVLLLADEPTANLDARTGRQVVELLIGSRRERTVIIVSHDQRSVDLATRIVYLEDGRLRDGRPE